METLGAIAIVFTVIGGIYGFLKKIISPRLFHNKLKRFYGLVKEWFDEIDSSNIDDVKITALYNKEKHITSFIEDNGLKYRKMIFTDFFRRQFLASCGLKKEFQDRRELFEKYSRCPADGMDIDFFWTTLVASFYKFYGKYKDSNPETNFADVEQRVKLLKLYTGVKAT